MNEAVIRAWWAHRQGLDGSLMGASAAHVLERTGWARSVGGVGPYLTLFARAGLVLLVLGMRHPYAVVSYMLAAFVLATILQEFQKGVTARRRIHGENPGVARRRTGTPGVSGSSRSQPTASTLA